MRFNRFFRGLHQSSCDVEGVEEQHAPLNSFIHLHHVFSISFRLRPVLRCGHWCSRGYECHHRHKTTVDREGIVGNNRKSCGLSIHAAFCFLLIQEDDGPVSCRRRVIKLVKGRIVPLNSEVCTNAGQLGSPEALVVLKESNGKTQMHQIRHSLTS